MLVASGVKKSKKSDVENESPETNKLLLPKTNFPMFTYVLPKFLPPNLKSDPNIVTMNMHTPLGRFSFNHQGLPTAKLAENNQYRHEDFSHSYASYRYHDQTA